MNDPLQPLSLASLPAETLEMIDEALADACRDVLLRPAVDKRRKVTLTIAIQPNMDPNTQRPHPLIECQVTYAVPGRKSMPIVGIIEGGVIKVNKVDLQNPLQYPLIDPGTGEVLEDPEDSENPGDSSEEIDGRSE